MGMQETSENFNSLRPILFELCKKKTTEGGKIDPLPAGIGLKSGENEENVEKCCCICNFLHFENTFLELITNLTFVQNMAKMKALITT